MSWAKPGVKCVCVDDEQDTYRPLVEAAGYQPRGSLPLVKGQVYTVHSVNLHPILSAVCVRLIEIPSRGGDISGEDSGYSVSRFRPLVTKTQEQDVAKFRHLLTPNPVDAGLVPAGVELAA